LVGFALETHNAVSYALKKLQEKHLDAIVLNSLADEGAGFGPGTNKVSFIHKNGKKLTFEVKPKQEVAIDIWNQIIASYE
jgi:phosphopantothenoylcysteine decarboxylase/phosphopantothenate--cysteine ligase